MNKYILLEMNNTFMEAYYKIALHNRRTWLLDQVKCEDVVDYLYEDSVISRDTYDSMLLQGMTPKDRTRVLLDTLWRYGPDVYRSFYRGLQKCGNDYSHVLQVLPKPQKNGKNGGGVVKDVVEGGSCKTPTKCRREGLLCVFDRMKPHLHWANFVCTAIALLAWRFGRKLDR
jgi:hypothetical protein